MIKFPCTFCGKATDTTRDLVRVPNIDSKQRIGRTISEYKCMNCGAFHALRFRAVGVFAYITAAPILALALFSYAPELAARTGAWLGRVAYRPVPVAPPNKSFKPMPLRGTA
ncbi:hypothetical protein GCM10011394_27850 [Luteimonas terricola]|uniref:Uncharacterized protein n=1 Tax=Luteimonas terricola TaxID=645597 RepID=A0ABQ2ERK1_9GAMM|nr:hypothetical protein GCM10011394_27850 [Luteimonas terricola]